ncbi:hypothetical protein INR49_005009 [Caranx melampygus]|nr:hypothetical protein INR49_005009 [Caranx melampygus]
MQRRCFLFVHILRVRCNLLSFDSGEAAQGGGGGRLKTKVIPPSSCCCCCVGDVYTEKRRTQTETFNSCSPNKPQPGTFVKSVLMYRFQRLFSWPTGRELHCGMRGLSNYHLSCCVNTLLQTLSATWEVADLLEKWDAAGLRGDRNVPLELKKVLAAMRSDRPHAAPHRDFLHCLDRHCLRLSVQHDADEVFLSILDLTFRQMNDEALADEIKSLYKIGVRTHLQCLQCNHVQSHSSYLLSLPLHIEEDDNSLRSCISSFLTEQELRGINCCFCEQCEVKTPSKQGVKLVSLPPILCVHLKRFRNRRGSTQNSIAALRFQKALTSLRLFRGIRSRFRPVVVHSGCATFGHYTAYVRNQGNQRWYYADDSHVEQVSWHDVERTYGGNHR